MKLQKRLAAQVLKCSPTRVIFDSESVDDIKEAITKHDIRGLVGQGIISKRPMNCASRTIARARKVQKSRGRRTGHGSRKGMFGARNPHKILWVNNVRTQRELIKKLYHSKKIPIEVYHELYMKVKGGFFRSRRHIKIFLTDKGILKEMK